MTNNNQKGRPMTDKMPERIYAQLYPHQDDGSPMIDAELSPHELLTEYIRADLAQPRIAQLEDFIITHGLEVPE